MASMLMCTKLRERPSYVCGVKSSAIFIQNKFLVNDKFLTNHSIDDILYLKIIETKLKEADDYTHSIKKSNLYVNKK